MRGWWWCCWVVWCVGGLIFNCTYREMHFEYVVGPGLILVFVVRGELKHPSGRTCFCFLFTLTSRRMLQLPPGLKIYQKDGLGGLANECALYVCKCQHFNCIMTQWLYGLVHMFICE